MKISKKILFILILSIGSFFAFNIMEFELLNQAINKNLQSLVFSAVIAISIIQPKLRIKLFYAAFLLLFLTAGFYLTNQTALSNSVAGIGIGIFLIVMLSYLPQLFKNGYVEKI